MGPGVGASQNGRMSNSLPVSLLLPQLSSPAKGLWGSSLLAWGQALGLWLSFSICLSVAFFLWPLVASG